MTDPHLILRAAALTEPPRAACVRRFLSRLAHECSSEPGLERASEWREQQLAADPPHDDNSALRRLMAEDLGPILRRAHELTSSLGPWAAPEEVLATALGKMRNALVGLGLPVPEHDVHLVERLPGPYDHPRLAGVALDRCDAEEYGAVTGIYLRRSRLTPYCAESTLGHVLIHALLGERSPELLGRGLEEGIAEVVGSLHLGGIAAGSAAIDAALAAHRSTPYLSESRESFLASTRTAQHLQSRHGLAGLAQLLREGRTAIKGTERLLGREELDHLPLPVTASPREPVDRDLAARLERLLSRPRPIAVGPLAFFLARALAVGTTVSRVASALGVEQAAARRAIAELSEHVYLVVLSAGGEVLAEDVDLVLKSGTLRYHLDDLRARHAG